MNMKVEFGSDNTTKSMMKGLLTSIPEKLDSGGMVWML